MQLHPWMIAAGVLLVVWILLNLKTSRPDGTRIRVHPYRALMLYIMPSRAESVVYFDLHVRADRLLAFIADARKRFDCDVTHCVVAALGAVLHSPAGARMNRFTSGRRMYRRKGVWLTFSMKRKKLDRDAKLAVVKTEVRESETFAELCGRINDKIEVERSGAATYADREFDLFLKLPRPLMNWAFRLCRWLDYHNCLPASFIAGDAMFTSAVIANLGSLGMGAGYHHLFEWGNCPLFAMVGAIEDRPVVEDGQVVVRKMMHLRYTYDERIDDGLSARSGLAAMQAILEDPYAYLGCVSEDGADRFSLSHGPASEL